MISKDTRFLIVGLGLLGGSYAKALSEQGYHVKAIEINQLSIDYAIQKQIIEDGSVSDTDMIKEADVIIFGLYPKAQIDWIRSYQRYFKPGILLTDVSGVKGNVVDVIQRELRSDVEFIASHPMAGKEVSGVKYSDASMFKVANFIIVPTEKNTQEAIDFLYELAKLLGFSHITQLSIQEHDVMIGFVSQLTHAIAVSLMNANDNTHLVEYTGDSFRDLTRIANINEHLWSELFFLNKENLIREINDFQTSLDDLKNKLIEDDADGLKQLFIQSTQRRKLFDKKQ